MYFIKFLPTLIILAAHWFRSTVLSIFYPIKSVKTYRETECMSQSNNIFFQHKSRKKVKKSKSQQINEIDAATINILTQVLSSIDF